jgi:CHASE2 domain-containing sensor protein
MSELKKDYWFPAKAHGWGWGPPTKWQGWVVIVLFIALLAMAGLAFPPAHSMLKFLSAVGLLSALLLAVCWKTGEPPKWRWGE